MKTAIGTEENLPHRLKCPNCDATVMSRDSLRRLFDTGARPSFLERYHRGRHSDPQLSGAEFVCVRCKMEFTVTKFPDGRKTED